MKVFALFQLGKLEPVEKSENYRKLAGKRDELNKELKKNESQYYVSTWIGRVQIHNN